MNFSHKKVAEFHRTMGRKGSRWEAAGSAEPTEERGWETRGSAEIEEPEESFEEDEEEGEDLDEEEPEEKGY